MNPNCPECNGMVKIFDNWCVECGFELANLPYCVRCANYLRNGSLFCHHCGHRDQHSQDRGSTASTDHTEDINSRPSMADMAEYGKRHGAGRQGNPDMYEQSYYDLIEEQESNYQSEIWLPPDYGRIYRNTGETGGEDLVDTSGQKI